MLINLVIAAMFVGTFALPIGLLIVGWTVEAHTHWIAPDIVSVHSPQISYSTQVCHQMKKGIALIGAGIILNFQCIQTYVVDAFTLYAASGAFSCNTWTFGCLLHYIHTALAAVAFLRSLAGGGFPLFAPAMYSALGFGKGNTVLAVIAIVIGCPA